MVRYNLGLTYYHRKQWPMAVQTLDVSGAHGFESLPLSAVDENTHARLPSLRKANGFCLRLLRVCRAA
jgi:hypothetical protein